MSEVILDRSEMIVAVMVGVMRQMECLQAGDKHRYGAKDDMGWQMHIEGAMGECAVAKHLNIFWGKGSRGGSDVGPHQVRTTSKHSNRLIVHPTDQDDARFYLVTGINGEYNVRGWIMGADAKQDRFWQDPTGNRPCYFVPQSELMK